MTDSPEKVKGPASYFPSIERTYGRPIDEWLDLVRARAADKHMDTVNWLKAEHGLPASDPDREARQMARLHELATEADLDPDLAKKFLAFIIGEVIRHHEKLQK